MKHWIQAARLRTLPLSLSGIIMGAFIAKWRLSQEGGVWDWRVFALALLVTLLYQILSNFANDYGDGLKGTDKNRIGEAEQRAVASGKITAIQMRNAVILLSILSFAATVALLYVAFYPANIREFWIFIGLGIACILAAIGYTVGKKPYGYMGLGDIFVFIFFGLVAVLGTEFTQAGRLSWSGLALAVGIGAMSSGVNLVNNIRDIPSDTETGKITLAVRLGNEKARLLFTVLLLLPFLLTIGIAFGSWLALAGLVYFPFALRAIRTVNRGAQGPELIPVLGLTGRAMLLWAIIEAAALILV